MKRSLISIALFTTVLVSCGKSNVNPPASLEATQTSTKTSDDIDVVCYYGEGQVNFVKDTNRTPLIVSANATLINGVKLKYYYNPFYGIGGKLELLENGQSKLLLSWKSDWQQSIHERTVELEDGSKLYCALNGYPISYPAR